MQSKSSAHHTGNTGVRILLAFTITCACMGAVAQTGSVSDDHNSIILHETARTPGVNRSQPRVPVQPGPSLRAPDAAWIESTLAGMTLDEKIGQMLMPGYSTKSSAVTLINNYHVGGFIFQGNSNTASAVQDATNYLQGQTATPLIFSTDCEAGLGARFTDATRFPLNMGAGAAYDLELTRKQGRVTARECRAIGIQIGFGPDVDVNTEPANPVIGIRSYSDNPSSVTALARAYVEGANAEGLLCTFKHFPGHGATAGDSHSGLQTVNISLQDLQANHVSPYATLLGEGLGDLVMSAHVWYPCLDPGTTPWPATLSTPALTGILRNQLHYEGCVISDSYAMAGLMKAVSTYDGVKISVLAGMDIILTPSSVADAFNGLKDRVISGEITQARINQSVRRILALKSRVGMPEQVTVPVSGLATVGHPDNLAIAEQIGRKAIAAKLDGGVVPVASSESVGIFTLEGYSTVFYSYNSSWFCNAMAASHSNTQIISVEQTLSASRRNQLAAQARQFDKVIVVSMERQPELGSSSQQALVSQMLSDGDAVAYISFGSPFQLDQFPQLKDYLCGFSSHYATQQQMARVILGDAVAGTNWPVKMARIETSVRDWALY